MNTPSTLLISTLSLISISASALQDYDDIYIDRDKSLKIHSIFCAKNLNNIAALKPAYVYTNTDTIAKGTYYYSSAYGNFSYTFNTIPNTPSQVLKRGLLKQGQTKKEQMQVDVCIVDKLDGLPPKLNQSLNHKIIEPNADNYNDWMVKYTAITGKPAYAKGVYQDPRNTEKYLKHDQAVFAANQAYVAKLNSVFSQKFDHISQGLGKKLSDAIDTADKNDGFLKTKTYPTIKEPTVWTTTSKERYNDQLRRLAQEKQWDIIIQQNFDWRHNLADKGTTLKSSQIIPQAPQWLLKGNAMVREQVSTLEAKLSNGKTIELDFNVTSSKVDLKYFQTLADISIKADNARRSLNAFNKKPQVLVNPESALLEVYSPTKKRIIFFSLFRETKMGLTVRLK